MGDSDDMNMPREKDARGERKAREEAMKLEIRRHSKAMEDIMKRTESGSHADAKAVKGVIEDQIDERPRENYKQRPKATQAARAENRRHHLDEHANGKAKGMKSHGMTRQEE